MRWFVNRILVFETGGGVVVAVVVGVLWVRLRGEVVHSLREVKTGINCWAKLALLFSDTRGMHSRNRLACGLEQPRERDERSQIYLEGCASNSNDTITHWLGVILRACAYRIGQVGPYQSRDLLAVLYQLERTERDGTNIYERFGSWDCFCYRRLIDRFFNLV